MSSARKRRALQKTIFHTVSVGLGVVEHHYYTINTTFNTQQGVKGGGSHPVGGAGGRSPSTENFLNSNLPRRILMLYTSLESETIIRRIIFMIEEIKSQNEQIPSPPKKFKVSSKKFWLTYARCSEDKMALFAFLQESFGALKRYCIVQETHQDDALHLHAVVEFVSKVDSRNVRVFDFASCHPNIQTLRTEKEFQTKYNYCLKEDVSPLSNIEEAVAKRDQMALDFLEIGPTRELIKKHPAIIFQNINNLKLWRNVWLASQAPKVKYLPKQRHWWIHGPSNCGKSYWLKSVMELFERPSQIPLNNDFSGVDAETDLLYFDEFKGQVTIQVLNLLCDGYTKVNTKGGSTFVYYPKVIICSNWSPTDLFRNVGPEILATILNRFVVFEFPDRANSRGYKYPLPSYEL